MTEPPQVEIGLRSKGDQIGTDLYEYVLTLTVTATAGGKTVFLVEVTQAGVFAHPRRAAGPAAAGAGDPLSQRPVPVCARSDRRRDDARWAFRPVHLAPINFEALYQQQLLAQAQQPVPAVTN